MMNVTRAEGWTAKASAYFLSPVLVIVVALMVTRLAPPGAVAQVSSCGNAIIEPPEQCDPPGSACSSPFGGFICDGTCVCVPPTTTTTTTLPSEAEHFKCYRTRDTTFPKFQSRTVSLADQFKTETVTVNRVLRLCNPADKNGGGINDPTQHLMCYRIKAGSFTRRDVPIRNQFGDQTVTVIKPESLCLPAEKDGVPLASSPNHFKCHRAKSKNFVRQTVTVADQFETRTGQLVKVRSFCNPVDKNGEGIPDPSNHLTCYRFKSGPPPFTPQDVIVMDQFGVQDLRSLRGSCRKVDILCVPTEKNPAPTTTTTTTTTPTTTTTSTTIASPSGAFLELFGPLV